MTSVPFKDGRYLVWDATCVDTLCVSHIASTSANPGAAAHNAETEKFAHYYDIMKRYDFRPIGFGTFGPAGREAKNLLFISKLLSSRTSGKRSGEICCSV